ncbi:MAG: DNA polymerase IV [Dehalococcoidales bacterium]|nr:DNA polymerase IV [Dehalococcoidales bacterium]
MAGRTIMHIDLDSFFVSVEQVLNPELKGKPVVVGGKPDRRGVVATASYEARAFGLHSGMPLATAVRLCPEAIFIEGNFARYREFSRKFMAIINEFSPSIEPMGLDEAYLDVTGFESIHGSIRQMADRMKQRIRSELGLCASVGIANCKVVAKIASELSKPDGLLEVTPGEEKDFLAPLPVEKLPGVGKQTLKIIKGLGVYTVGGLSRMSPRALKTHLGSAGEMLYRFANGIDDRQVLPPGEAKSISRESTFGEDTRDLSYLEATLWVQSEKVGADLRKKGKQAKCVTLKLRYADFSTITRSRTLNEGVDTDRAIFETGIGLLERALAKEKQAVRLIGIGVSKLVEASRQTMLFAPSDRKLEELNKAIDSIRNKHGFDAIHTGRVVRLRDISFHS